MSRDVVSWRAFYADGGILAGEAADAAAWEGLPDAGMIHLCLIEDGEWRPGKPYKRALEAEWFGRTADGAFVLWDQESEPPIEAVWKRGLAVPDDVMEWARQEANRWP